IIAYDPKRRYVAEGTVNLANKLTQSDEIVFAVPNFVSEFQRLGSPSLIAAQWHLNVVKARQAWGTSLGKGVTIAIIDDGIDVDHPNLKPNIRLHPDRRDRRDVCGRDFFLDESTPGHFDPRPKIFQSPYDQAVGNDNHGTACAGVAAASGSLDGVRGAAPKA